MTSSVHVTPVISGSDRKIFFKIPYLLYGHDPHWVAPLLMEEHLRLNPKKNPFFKNGEASFWVAWKDGKAVGRISAQVNHLHNERYQEKTGHFGYFDCINDQEVAQALLNKARQFLQGKGMNKIVGPMTLSINEYVGLLVEGFDSRPYPYMAHNAPYASKLLEEAGFQKVKDLLAWKYDALRPVPETAQQIADVVAQYPGLVIRELNLKKMDEEIHIVSDVFNSAWSKNWGFIPWSDAEIKQAAKDLKMILHPKLALIAEVEGKPAAISIAIPNYHEAIYDLKGRLFPFGIFKFLYRMKVKNPKTARLCLLGIKKEFRHDVLGGLSVLLYCEMHKRGQTLGMTGGELSWTLEDNVKINTGIELMGGVAYKKYRVYEKTLSA